MGSSSSSSPGAIARQFLRALYFCRVPDDLLFNILCRLDDDPRHLARLACVSTRFCNIIKSVCWKLTCEKALPLLVAELLQAPSSAQNPLSEPPGGWAALQKLHVCCPGLWHAGVLLRNWDFELDQELDWLDEAGCSHPAFPAAVASQILGIPYPCDSAGKKAMDEQHKEPISRRLADDTGSGSGVPCLATADAAALSVTGSIGNGGSGSIGTNYVMGPDGHESKHGTDSSKDGSHIESHGCIKSEIRTEVDGVNVIDGEAMVRSTMYAGIDEVGDDDAQSSVLKEHGHVYDNKQKRRRKHELKNPHRDCHHVLCHIATGSRNLSREQGNKLLANRFRTDSLYICDWPGCIHPGDKRIYKLFRGVFKNFKSSHVYRNLKDMQAKPMNVGCAFCVCKCTWDMVTSFCLKRSIEFHDDGEPVVRAYVCENGHVAGAWTDRPIYLP